MRRGEVLAVRWKCFDEVNGLISVEEAVNRDHFDTPKTERSRRQIPLPLLAMDLLAGWKKIAKRTGPEDLIFGTRAGKPQSPSNMVRRHVFPACERLGFPRRSEKYKMYPLLLSAFVPLLAMVPANHFPRFVTSNSTSPIIPIFRRLVVAESRRLASPGFIQA
jgi:hypothetical protein